VAVCWVTAAARTCGSPSRVRVGARRTGAGGGGGAVRGAVLVLVVHR